MKPTPMALGHAAFHPHADRPIRQPSGAGQALRTIAASEEEFTAACQFLAKRRAKLGQRGRTATTVPHGKGKQN